MPWWREVADDHQLVEEDSAPAESTCFDDSPVPEPDPFLDFNAEIDRFARARGVPRTELASGVRTARLTRERQLLVVFLLRRGVYSNRGLARMMKRDRSTVSRWLINASQRSQTDLEFRTALAETEKLCSECSE